MEEKEFLELLIACKEIAEDYPEGIVFIGGMAVYLHAVNEKESKAFAEFTHDADFYISIADMSDLRDNEEVTANRRLNKHQLRKRGFEFDIYTERHSALVVPYDQVLAYACVYENIRVASLEHLLVLKLEAYCERFGSAKGQKDAKDLIQIAILANISKHKFNPKLCGAYLNDDHLKSLAQIEKSPAFLSMTKGNAKHAKELRVKFTKFRKHFS